MTIFTVNFYALIFESVDVVSQRFITTVYTTVGARSAVLVRPKVGF